MRLLAMTCGWLAASLGNFIDEAGGKIRVPVPCYLIDHPRGLVLFDSGLHRDTQRDPVARLGQAVADYFRVDFQPGQEISARLAAIGVEPAEVRFLVNSHLHFDHAGGNAELPNATLIVQRPEWEAGREPELAAANYFDARDYDLGHDLRLVDGEHDVFGDGRVTCIPTYGHTPGHQSLRVRLDSGEIVLAGDACYLRRSLDELRLPPIAHDRERALGSLRKLRDLRDRGVRVFYGHDPEFWADMPQAPADIV